MAGKSQEDEEFQQILSEIGGKERIHLVSESWNPQDGNPPQLVEELVKDIFHSPFLEYRDDATDNFNHMASNISNGSVSAGDKSQENQTSFERTSTSNYVSRAKALHSSQGGELMQPQRPQGLEMNAKRDEEDTEKATAVKRGNAVNRGSGLSEMLQCFPWSHRGVQRNAATSTSINGKQGGADCVEECVPLTKTSTANVQQAGCNMSG
ncbi:uncharacterized protein LOC125709224 isoform X2 [Brienomyrus brachyistius]|uniref:uncharacterized protein LOC125709224 isoform X2 n=1 Tax=Brienomyrus brachyistius TaxID=42636 RepID=UPI0020B1FE29|nr:uncharacterized protein LOC125709224 isoform X2 [Brienomyrus brachyistius]